MLSDLRYAWRLIRRQPGFSSIAILSLALATGTATAVFGVADALLFKTLAVERPNELASSHTGSHPLLDRVRALRDVIAGAAGISLLDRYNVTIGDAGAVDNGPVRVALVTGNYFRLLGVGADLGRTLMPDDDRIPGGHPVAMISARYRQRYFAGDASVIGRRLSLNDVSYTIVGVAPPSFAGDTIARPVDIWIPTMMQSQVMTELPGLLTRTTGWLRLIVRMQPGVTLERAQAAMRAVYVQSELQAAGSSASAEVIRSIQRSPFELVPIGRGYARDRGDLALSLEILAAVVSLLLVIACANLANLLLARAEARHREMAIRSAVGGGRWRLVRQLLTESVVLALVGGAVGVVVAIVVTDALSSSVAFGPTQLDSRAPSSWLSFDVRLGGRGVLFGGALSIIAGLMFGLGAALRGGRASIVSALGAGLGVNRRASRLGDLLVVAQVALSLTLVVDAALFVRSLQHMKSVDLGVDRQRLLLVWTNPGQTRPVDTLIETARQIRDRLSALPGVTAVSMSNHGLLEGNEGGSSSDSIQVDGQPAAPGLQVFRDAVAPGFFAAAGTPVRSGREFSERDGATTPHVVVINRTLARFLFGERDPVGRRIGLPTDRTPVEIVGVVSDVRHGTPRDARGVWYVPAAQYPGLMRTMCLVVRTAGDPMAAAPGVRRELMAIDSKLPILHIDTVAEQLDDVLIHERIVAAFSSVLGSLALCIAAVGLYGIVWYTLARRTSEIGIRIALGATRGTIISEAIGGVLARTLAGVVIATPLAIACARLAASRLAGVGSAEPLTIVVAASLMVTIASIAAAVPAYRASAISPLAALRAQL